MSRPQDDSFLGDVRLPLVLLVEEDIVEIKRTASKMIDVAVSDPPDIEIDLALLLYLPVGDVSCRGKAQRNGNLILPHGIQRVLDGSRPPGRSVVRNLDVSIDGASVICCDNLIDAQDLNDQIDPIGIDLVHLSQLSISRSMRDYHSPLQPPEMPFVQRLSPSLDLCLKRHPMGGPQFQL